MRTQLFVLLLFFSEFDNICGVKNFAIIGPRTVHHRSLFKIFLTTVDYKVDDKTKIFVSLEGTTAGEIKTHELELSKSLSQELEFDLAGEKKIENYTLIVEVPQEKFVRTVTIFTIAKAYSVFIQTDKPVYRPGETVKFRVIVLDSELKPYQFKKMRVEFSDHLGRVLKMFPFGNDLEANKDHESEEEAQTDDDYQEETNPGDDETSTSKVQSNNADDSKDDIGIDYLGIFGTKTSATKATNATNNFVSKSEYKLSDDTVLGMWNINVTIDDSEMFTNKTFEVKEYILPRCDLKVDTKSHIALKDGKIQLRLSASYTFDMEAAGTTKVVANIYDTGYPTIVQNTKEKSFDLPEGKTAAEFDLKTDLRIFAVIRTLKVDFEIEFTEKLTGQRITKYVTVMVSKNDEVAITIERNQEYFKPGYPFNVSAVVKTLDGSPVHYRTPVKFTVEYNMKVVKCVEMTGEKPIYVGDFQKAVTLKDGAADLSFKVPFNATSISIKAEYNEVSESINVARFQSDAREYLVAKLLFPPKVGNLLSIIVEGNGAWRDTLPNAKLERPIYSLIIGKTGIVHQSAHTEIKKNKRLLIKIETSNWMVPVSNFIVYYIHHSGEIIYDLIKLNFETSFRNNMKIKLSTDKTKPGSKCTLTITTSPNSYVALLGVDESVTLLGYGNDIDRKRVVVDLDAYNANEHYPKLDVAGDTSKRYLDFGNSNAFMITNALGGEMQCDQIVAKKSGTVINEEDDDDDSGNEHTPMSSKLDEKPRKRTNFIETWIFDDYETNAKGELTLTKEVPDTITSFIVTGFGIDSEKGLAIATQERITVVQDFFLKLYMPQSVRFGEILKVDVSVFNRITRPKKFINVEVELMKTDDLYDIVELSSGNNCAATTTSNNSKHIEVAPESATSTYFLVRSLVVGNITISVRARTVNREDHVEKILVVENEGITTYVNKPYLFDMRKGATDRTPPSHNFQIVIPEVNILRRSIKIGATVMGDLIGPALNNIEKLVKMPYGCNEQQFSSWIPNIVVANYLDSIGKLTNDFKGKLRTHIEKGYQTLANIRNSDGSYSMFSYIYTKSNEPRSIWLTAYFAKMHSFFKPYAPNILDYDLVKTLKFLKSIQNSDGSFTDSTPLHFTYEGNTRSNQGVALTAFVAIAFLKNKPYLKDFQDVVDRAINFTNIRAFKLEDNYDVALASYALSLAKHNSTDKFLESLLDAAIVQDNKMYWNREMLSRQSSDSPSINVEIAAYATLALIQNRQKKKAWPILNWLMTQRNEDGGFYTTTDTVVGVEAVALMAAKDFERNGKLTVKLDDHKTAVKSTEISDSSKLQQTYQKFNEDVTDINVNVIGEGFAYIQVSYQYNTISPDPEQKFDLSVNVLSTGKNVLRFKVCAKYIPTDNNMAKMTLMQIDLPSGYVYDTLSNKNIMTAGARKIEQPSPAQVVLYFDQFTNIPVCITIDALRERIVMSLKKSAIKIFDYTTPTHSASAFYEPYDGTKHCGF